MLKGKTVVVGVCGGIAAYKVVDVVSRLTKLEATVHVIMTKNATQFVTPLTFQSISHNPVIGDTFEEPRNWDIQHIAIANKADFFLIAPATANIIGKVAAGIADDMLSTTIMATKAPVLFVPAMNPNMYENPVTQDNMDRLKSLGYIFMEPGVGPMAERGFYGKGRLPEPREIVQRVSDLMNPLPVKTDMAGLKVLVTAGPTQEPLDPVRYITNHSSGKMGFAIAEAARDRGAAVTLVSGPVTLPDPAGVRMLKVKTADEMHGSVMSNYQEQDILIMIAAVADYKSKEIADLKMKKSGNTLSLTLVKNPDIAKDLGKVKEGRILVGACAETDNLIQNAKQKIESKNLDMIIANDVTMEGAGFGVDTNIVKLVKNDGTVIDYPKMLKSEVAHGVMDEIVKIIQSKTMNSKP